MKSFGIPKQHQEGLVQLLKLSNEDVEAISRALKDVPATLKPSTLKSRLTSAVSAIPAEKINVIVNTLIALGSLRFYLDISIPDFTEQLSKSMEESGNDELKIADEDRERFKGDITKLLDSQTLTVSAKAPDVWFEHKHAFCSARILTDVRPVFGERPEDSPIAAGIVHTLKISFHVGDKLEDFFVAMDAGDVRTLKEVLERAELKYESLKAVLETTKVQFLDSE